MSLEIEKIQARRSWIREEIRLLRLMFGHAAGSAGQLFPVVHLLECMRL